MKAKQEEAKRKAEEQRIKYQEDQRIKMEQKKKQQEEMLRKAEEAKKKAAEDKVRREEEQKKRLEQMKKQQEEQSALKEIRQKIQKVRAAAIPAFEQAEKELQEIIEKKLDACGTHKVAVQAEIEKGLAAAKERQETLKEAEKKAEEKRNELAEKKKADEEKAAETIKELAGVIEESEEAVDALKKAAEALDVKNTDKLKEAEVTKLGKKLDEAAEEAKEKGTALQQFMKDNGTKLQAGSVETKKEHAALMTRMNAASKGRDGVIKTSGILKEKAIHRAQARKAFDLTMAKFKQYDTNKDGFLDEKELTALAKKEYSCIMPKGSLTRILQAFSEPGTKGIVKEHFNSIKIQIGVAREKVKDLERKKKREKREKELDAIKEEYTAKIKEVDEVAEEQVKAVKEIEDGSANFVGGKSMTMTSVEMFAAAEEIEAKIEAAKPGVASLQEKVKGLKEDLDPDLNAWFAQAAQAVTAKAGSLGPRLDRSSTKCTNFKGTAKSKEKVEMTQVEKKAVALIKNHRVVKELSESAVVEEICGGEDEATEAKFLSFFETCEKQPPTPEPAMKKEEKKEADKEGDKKEGDAEKKDKPEPPKPLPVPTTDELKRLFKFWDDEAEGFPTKERLATFSRNWMKVIKETVLTDEISITESKTVRRLEVGEILEVLVGPVAGEVTRARVKALNDGKEGWATISGSKGSTYLQPGGNIFKCVKETILTEDFELDGSSSKGATRKLKDTTRKLKPGELVEVRVWMAKEEKTGLMRMKCKTLSDGLLGWATTTGNQGTVYLQAK